MKGKNILIAGGTGLVGANLTKKLSKFDGNILSTYFSKEPAFLKECYRRFDFTKFEDCVEATKDMDYVFICAAQIFGSKVMKENPTASILPNLNVNVGLLDACKKNKVEKVMLISSSTVYQQAFYPIREDQLNLNESPYSTYVSVGWLNRYIEQLACLYHKIYNIKIGIVRATSIYGPYDQFDDEKSHVIPALIKRALKKENPYVVWGTGNGVRDFIYVDDFIEMILDVFDHHCLADPINIGNGESMNVKKVVEIILDIANHRVTPVYDETKPTTIPYRRLDLTKFNSLFGKKKMTFFEHGIQKTIDWYKRSVQ